MNDSEPTQPDIFGPDDELGGDPDAAEQIYVLIQDTDGRTLSQHGPYRMQAARRIQLAERLARDTESQRVELADRPDPDCVDVGKPL